MSNATLNGSFFRLNSRVLKFVIVISCVFFAVLKIYYVDMNFSDINTEVISQHHVIVEQFYKNRKHWKLSKLGEVMYMNKNYPIISEERRNKTYIIYKANHKSGTELRGCSVSNCIFTGDKNKFQTADAVIIRLQLGKIPKLEQRNPKQIWMFLNDESPRNVFGLAKRKVALSELHNVFNWSLTYRSESDVPVPYGRTVPLKMPIFSNSNFPIENLVPNWSIKRQDVLVAILISNCVSYRMKLIRELNKFIHVDVHGKCGEGKLKKSCPGHFRVDCKLMSEYLFYLVLENTKCKEYMTEKLFYNAYSKGAIPIIQGPTMKECETFLPPNSYLHVDNYTTIKALADDILRISKSKKDLLYYHQWRKHFDIANEHGYFGVKSLRLCRVCEAMNYNDKTMSVYSEKRLKDFLDQKTLCRN